MPERAVTILGLGMQGQAALHYLAHHTDVERIIVADCNPDAVSCLKRYKADRVSFHQLDVNNKKKLSALISDSSILVESLPGSFALQIGKLAARSGISMVSSMYYLNPAEDDPQKIQALDEEIRQLDNDARRTGAVILAEFGLDPGIDLVMASQAISELDTVEMLRSYGAGLPEPGAANNPLKYKFSWSVIGVMRAYSRPASMISNGRPVQIAGVEIFSPENVHVLEVKELGLSLECYPNGNSNRYAELLGIREQIRDMGRYACRYPGHCAFWEKVSKCGFLDDTPIELAGVEVSPIAFVAELLGRQQQFQYSECEKDFALVRVEVKGIKDGEKKHFAYQLIDWRDLETGFTAMQRTVGFTMGLGAHLILEGKLSEPGLITPLDVPFKMVSGGLSDVGMRITREDY